MCNSQNQNSGFLPLQREKRIKNLYFFFFAEIVFIRVFKEEVDEKPKSYASNRYYTALFLLFYLYINAASSPVSSFFAPQYDQQQTYKRGKKILFFLIANSSAEQQRKRERKREEDEERNSLRYGLSHTQPDALAPTTKKRSRKKSRGS